MGYAACEICETTQWTHVYAGPVRDGGFGSCHDGADVAECGSCGVRRLREDCCIPASAYETDQYRAKLGAGLDSVSYFANHDRFQLHTLAVLPRDRLRDSTVADVGCGAGALLDHVRGLTSAQLAIEPCALYHADLAARGYHVFPYVQDALSDWRGCVDVAFSIQVIEHTQNPRAFLEDIRPLLRPGGCLIVSTPNSRDILMDLLPDEYPPFFYRVVHRWYFDAASLATCARLAGFEVAGVAHVHRYGLANAMQWLRDRRPCGDVRLPVIENVADQQWTAYLEMTGRSDCLFVTLTAPAEEAAHA
jgi:SAM-dependent methyltransferase